MVLREMIKSLPLYERENTLITDVFNAEAKQFKKLQQDIDDVKRQLFVDTATWGLKIYEKELNIAVPTNSTLESRRAVIKSKWRSDGKADRALLEAVASAILKTNVRVGFNGHILFFFDVSNQKITNLDLMNKTINQVKPAHLTHDVEARLNSYIVISGDYYNFEVPYPITNQFSTAQVKGGLAKIEMAVNAKTYNFAVQYPVTNQFSVSGSSGKVSDTTIGLDSYTSHNKILYKRVGETIPGEDSARKPTGKHETAMSLEATANSNSVIYSRVGDPPGKGQFE